MSLDDLRNRDVWVTSLLRTGVLIFLIWTPARNHKMLSLSYALHHLTPAAARFARAGVRTPVRVQRNFLCLDIWALPRKLPNR